VSNDGPVVREITADVYVIPTDAPEADGTLAWDKTTVVLASARAGAARGIGWSYAAAAAQSVIADVLAGALIGGSALDVPAAAEAMARAVRNIGRPGIAATAISAVDIALWDLKARLLGCSVVQLLGQARDRVPVYGSGGFTSYDDDQTREQLAGWVDKDHIPRVKIKIGESWAPASTGTSSGWRWPARSSGRTPSSSWTPTAAIPPDRPCGWPAGWRSTG
jgi:L-alanine-DL-glutamate epimerase-like enolase superfamily enzyme